ncbi:MAG: hydantoinase B/oxoprolinase family protein, partial [Candidatus Rokubacteria bacterium]|nr:hydantoinase B/oxoprolinase family protein [Candidatus Rokubacteria bacterium]
EGVASPIANTQNTSAELIEAMFPLRVEHYGFVPDTSGAGRHRGGIAIRRDVRFLGRRGVLQIRSWSSLNGIAAYSSPDKTSSGSLYS